MPHYADGREAKVGDIVQTEKRQYPTSVEVIGILLNINLGTTSCNAQVLPLARRYSDVGSWHRTHTEYTECVTLSEMLLNGLIDKRSNEVPKVAVDPPPRVMSAS